MRIGALHITVMTEPHKAILRQEIRDYITSEPVWNAISRIARGEVKNYLAEIAEEAEIPYTSPIDFMREARKA
jgi:hypothetical protein